MCDGSVITIAFFHQLGVRHFHSERGLCKVLFVIIQDKIAFTYIDVVNTGVFHVDIEAELCSNYSGILNRK